MTDPAQLYQQAIAAFNHRDWRGVLERSAELLPIAAGHDGLHYITGIAAQELQAPGLAARHLAEATRLAPGNASYAIHHARALISVRMTREALTEAQRALTLGPENPADHDTLGVIFSFCNDYTQAASAFERAVMLAPNIASYRFNLATALVASGELIRAERELNACIELDPQHWKAYLTLSQLHKQTPEANHIALLQHKLDTADDDLSAKLYLHLALSKEFEDLGQYASAFDHLTLGKLAGGKQRNYDSRRDEALFESLMQAFAHSTESQGGYETSEPIFIIGMPRSGTTLVDRIVSSHPDVQTAGELQNFSVVLKQATGSQTPFLLDPDTIARSQRLDWIKLGKAYVDSTRPLTGSKPHFIDKLPHNFLYAGHIAKALPRAKIVLLRRNPIDTCLSNFRQLFTLISPYYDYSFDLLDIGRYFVGFDRLMKHWQRVLPGRILEVSYEELVGNQESLSRKVLAFCDLPWNDACLQFHENAAPVATASAVQVREPINRHSIDRWRRYEPQLLPLIALLRENGIEI